ncbi:unnamed protein product [Arabidopsis halleri]
MYPSPISFSWYFTWTGMTTTVERQLRLISVRSLSILKTFSGKFSSARVIDVVDQFMMANGKLVRVFIHTDVTKYLSFKAVDGSYVVCVSSFVKDFYTFKKKN